ncbi:hypothetical protein LF817_19760 [Halobacillus sp. A1]|uniref:hypothetical protein n=1 Tax=Halobacillus sp. A1 TaxID=2880262 RepID=UPI0020A62B9F|nr:hypothetical protein [Halobacillus sp. A1]MCP3033563.1 hypothetical protein [Halobacillus sp. A1]
MEHFLAELLTLVTLIFLNINWGTIINSFIAAATAWAAYSSFRAARSSEKNVRILKEESQKQFSPKLYIDSEPFKIKKDTILKDTILNNEEWMTKKEEQKKDFPEIKMLAFSPYFINLYNLGRGPARAIRVSFECPLAKQFFNKSKIISNYEIKKKSAKNRAKDPNKKIMFTEFEVTDNDSRVTKLETTSPYYQEFMFLRSAIDENIFHKVNLPKNFTTIIYMYSNRFGKVGRGDPQEILDEIGINHITDLYCVMDVEYKDIYFKKADELKFERFIIKLSSLNSKSAAGTFELREAGSEDLVGELHNYPY